MRAGRAWRALAGIAFFASGVAGLVYQVVWQRILALHTGIGIYSVALIVAAFMAGLGLGSFLGGILSARASPRRALVAFGALELGVALFGIWSTTLYHDLLGRLSGWYDSAFGAAGLHFLSLALPTTLMGMTLPLLTRALVTSAQGASRTIGLLYALNMLGAALGAWLTPWVLVRHHGLRGATLVAAGANALAALLALALATRSRPSARHEAAALSVDTAPGAPLERQPFGTWVALYALSGFCALGLEVVWFRLLDVAVKSSAFTFGTLLALYLLGTGAGCLLGLPLVPRLYRPLRAFLWLQCALLAWSALAVALLVRLPAELPGLARLVGYWGGTHGYHLGVERDPGLLALLYGLLPALLFGPPTVMMGLSFPALQRAVQDEVRSSGRKVGLLQAANIAGCVAGSLLAGLGGLTWWGASGTLRALVLLAPLFAWVGWRATRERGFLLAVMLMPVVAFVIPDQDELWWRLHGARDVRALVQEDATAVGAIVPVREGRFGVFVNGKNHSWVPFQGIHTQLGALPALVHPAPVDVALVGLGSGDTAWAAGCREETRNLTVYEIAAPLPSLLRRLGAREGGPPNLRAFLDDARVRLSLLDGRHAIARGAARWDLIEADALWPQVSGSGNLYSVEFFGACAARLKPGGVMCTWSPTGRVVASFRSVFPYVLANGARTILIGSSEPLELQTQAWLERLQRPATRAYLGAHAGALAVALQDLSGPLRPRRFAERDLNRDLFARDEFASP